MEMKAGIYPGLDNEFYHSMPGISNSGISLLRQSPKKYWYKYLSGQYKKVDGKDKVIGSALHTLVLEPSTFFSRYSIYPNGIDRRNKKGKAAYEDYKQLCDGKLELKREEFDLVQAMANSMKSHPLYEHIFTDGHVEDSLIWQQGDLWLRSRPDFYNARFAVDVKTTKAITEEEFKRSLAEYGYHRQAHFTLTGLNELYPLRHYEVFILFVVEKDPPHLCAMYVLDDAAINIGKIEVEQALETYRICVETNTWFGYSEQVQTISLPQWYKITEPT